MALINRIPDDDPRVGLRGQYGLFASTDLGLGHVVAEVRSRIVHMHSVVCVVYSCVFVCVCGPIHPPILSHTHPLVHARAHARPNTVHIQVTGRRFLSTEWDRLNWTCAEHSEHHSCYAYYMESASEEDAGDAYYIGPTDTRGLDLFGFPSTFIAHFVHTPRCPERRRGPIRE